MMQRSLGFNLLHFADIVLKSEFWYWTFALGTCCVAWTTVLIAHTGCPARLREERVEL